MHAAATRTWAPLLRHSVTFSMPGSTSAPYRRRLQASRTDRREVKGSLWRTTAIKPVQHGGCCAHTCKTATLGNMQIAATHSDWKALLKSITEPLKVRPKGPSAAAPSYEPTELLLLLFQKPPLLFVPSTSTEPGGQVPCRVPKMCSATAPSCGATRAPYTPSSSSPGRRDTAARTKLF